jgi:hypothetical protein
MYVLNIYGLCASGFLNGKHSCCGETRVLLLWHVFPRPFLGGIDEGIGTNCRYLLACKAADKTYVLQKSMHYLEYIIILERSSLNVLVFRVC